MIYKKDFSLIKVAVIIGEIILLNIVLLLSAIGCNYSLSDLCCAEGKSFLIYFNLAYLISISNWGIVLHKRMVRIEEIFDKVFKLILLQYLVLLVILLVTNNMNKFSLFFISLLISSEFSSSVLWRLLMRNVIKSFRSRDKNKSTIIILGSGNVANEVYNGIIRNINNGYQFLGFFDDRSESDFVVDRQHYKGSLNDVVPFLKENNVDEIFCALPAGEDRKAIPVLNYAENNLIRFYFIPDFKRFLTKKVNLQFIDNIPIVFIRSEPLESYSNRVVKRLFDIFASFLFLITVFPWLLFIIGIAIKFSSRGPVFFKQKRTGKNGEDFICIKFRSMNLNKEANERPATKNDERVTRIGAFLRKTNLDETPQFVNVLIGDMSIVGPRPHMLKQTEEYSRLIDKYMLRHLAKPGITGLAQITGCRGETRNVQEMEKRIQRDVWYLENWTFWGDIKIIFQTVVLMIKGDENAY